MTTTKLDQASAYLRIARKAERAGDLRAAERYEAMASRLAFEQRLDDEAHFGTSK